MQVAVRLATSVARVRLRAGVRFGKLTRGGGYTPPQGVPLSAGVGRQLVGWYPRTVVGRGKNRLGSGFVS